MWTTQIPKLLQELVEIALGVPAFEGYGLQLEGYGLQLEGYGLQPVHQVLPFQQRALAPEGIESQFELSQSLFQQVPGITPQERLQIRKAPTPRGFPA